MTSRVVVGFDGSPAAIAALRWAAAEARLRRAELQAYVVTRHDESDGADLRLPDGYPVPLRHRIGDTAACLGDVCGPGDVLVVGTRARSTLGALILGSVTRACLAHSPCPVVTVRDQLPYATRGWVVAGVRAPGTARHTLTAAAEEARLRASGLVAMHVQPPANVGADLFTAAENRLVEQSRAWLIRESAGTGVHAVPEVVVGSTAEALIHRSSHASLLVLGAHDSGISRGGAPGATILQCVRRASCPVMVVPAPPKPGERRRTHAGRRTAPGDQD
ncbi:universal stress protein [Actinoplanes sp. NPDC049316]|uniref:universal stress protein n=1 Tax=Actinoplanes sp. NPDC049316 TaxID=3154727 RepID=UPI003411F7CE